MIGWTLLSLLTTVWAVVNANRETRWERLLSQQTVVVQAKVSNSAAHLIFISILTLEIDSTNLQICVRARGRWCLSSLPCPPSLLLSLTLSLCPSPGQSRHRAPGEAWGVTLVVMPEHGASTVKYPNFKQREKATWLHDYLRLYLWQWMFLSWKNIQNNFIYFIPCWWQKIRQTLM